MHPASLWAATAPPDAGYPTLRGHTETDVCVIGAGYTGLSAALHLAEQGASVTVLEAMTPGWGASGRNGGQVIPGLKLSPDSIDRRWGRDRGERLVDFARRAPDLVFDLITRWRIDCQPVRKGWIRAVHSAAALGPSVELARQWQRRGAPVDMLDRRGISALLGADTYLAGMLDRGGGAVQPLAYVRGLAGAASGAGARLFAHTPALSIAARNSRWQIATPEGCVDAGCVLVATNAHGTNIWPGLGRTFFAVPSCQLATRPLNEALRRQILPGGQVVSDTQRLLLYFRLDPDARLVAGYTGGLYRDRRGKDLRSLVEVVTRKLPQIPLQLEFSWSGTVAVTTDSIPHLHELAPGVFSAIGYSGRGIAMATALGRVLADLVTGRRADAVAFPVTPLKRVPLHRLLRPLLHMTLMSYRLLDVWDARRPMIPSRFIRRSP